MTNKKYRHRARQAGKNYKIIDQHGRAVGAERVDGPHILRKETESDRTHRGNPEKELWILIGILVVVIVLMSICVGTALMLGGLR